MEDLLTPIRHARDQAELLARRLEELQESVGKAA